MINFEILDNSIVNYVPITPSKPVMFFIPTEESNVIGQKDLDGNVVQNNPNNLVTSPSSYTLTAYNSLYAPGSQSPTQYVGAVSHQVEAFLNPDFVDFKFTKLSSTQEEDLFLTDSDKIIELPNKIHLLEIPANRFINTDNTIGYGDYYLKVSSKKFKVTIKNIIQKEHVSYYDLNTLYQTSNANYLKANRRTIYEIDKNNFIGTIWNFEETLSNSQKGRLFGSLVEVYSSDGTYKTTKIIAENALNLDGTGTYSQLTLSPDYIGIGNPNEEIIVNDYLYIYPIETFFNPIYINIKFTNPSNSVNRVRQFLMNDVVRDLSTGVFEIYDEDGVTISQDGSINGNVIESFQVSKTDNKELRKKVII